MPSLHLLEGLRVRLVYRSRRESHSRLPSSSLMGLIPCILPAPGIAKPTSSLQLQEGVMKSPPLRLQYESKPTPPLQL